MAPMSTILAGATDDGAVIAAIIISRLLLPLLIPRSPLVILAALVLDAIDGSLLDALTSVDTGPNGPYQSFDKALDIYYLAIAYLSTLRNWTSPSAFRVGQFLFYYRLVGVLAFELLDSRAMLLIFPNTFEFFFIAYEALRTRFDPQKWQKHFWVWVAAGLWIFVKLPQEYWIHIAQLDFTEAVDDHPWFGVACALGILALVAIVLFVVRPRLREPEWGWQFAAERLGPLVDAAPTGWRELGEKSVLLALISVIFGAILPQVQVPPLGIVIGVVIVVSANMAPAVLFGRHRGTTPAAFVGLLATNLAFVYLGSRLLSHNETFPLGTGLFFALLLTLLTWLYDRYKPVHDARAPKSDIRGHAPA